MQLTHRSTCTFLPVNNVHTWIISGRGNLTVAGRDSAKISAYMYVPYRTCTCGWDMLHVHCTVRACTAHTGSHVDALLRYRIGLFVVVKLPMLTYRDSIPHVKVDNFAGAS